MNTLQTAYTITASTVCAIILIWAATGTGKDNQ